MYIYFLDIDTCSFLCKAPLRLISKKLLSWGLNLCIKLDIKISAVSEVHFLSHPVEFHVEATGIANRLSLCVSSPQGGGGGVTVGAGQAHPPRGRL